MEKVKARVHYIMMAIVVIVFVVTYVVFGYGMYPDSYSYISAHVSAEPLYPLILKIFRSIFGDNLYLWIVAFGEMVLAAYSVWLFAYKISKRFSLKWFYIVAVYSLLLAFYLLPAFFSVSHLITYLAILTEGITYPMYLIWFISMIETVAFGVWKKWFVTLGITAILMMIRPAMLPLIVYDVVIGLYLAIKNHYSWKKTVLILISCAGLYMIVTGSEALYFRITTGSWTTHTSGAVTMMADVLYVCDDDDVELFDDADIRQIFEDIVADMRANQYGYMFAASNGIIEQAEYMEYCHDYIKMESFLRAMSVYYEVNHIEDNFERLQLQDRFASEITKPILKMHFSRWVKCYIGNCYMGLVRTVATAPSLALMRLYSVVVVIFAIVGVVIFRQRKDIIEFVCLAWLSVAAIVTSTSLVIMCLQRYMVYNFPLVYTGFVIMLNCSPDGKMKKTDVDWGKNDCEER